MRCDAMLPAGDGACRHKTEQLLDRLADVHAFDLRQLPLCVVAGTLKFGKLNGTSTLIKEACP
jgi:hypothetical protein